MEQQTCARRRQKIVRSDLVGSSIVSLRACASKDGVGLVQAAQTVNAGQQLISNPMHNLLDLPVDVRMQAAEIGHTGGGPHAAQKAISFYQDGAAFATRGSDCSGYTRWPSSEDNY